MDNKYTKAREIVEVFDDFLNDKLANRGIELNCDVPVATEDAKKKNPRMFDTRCMIYGHEWSQMVEEIARML